MHELGCDVTVQPWTLVAMLHRCVWGGGVGRGCGEGVRGGGEGRDEGRDDARAYHVASALLE